MKKAFITGVTGQDGSYLAELLLAKGYEVHGLTHRASGPAGYAEPLRQDPSLPFHLHEGDLANPSKLAKLLRETAPDEVYNLAAQSDDVVSLAQPEATAEVNGMGPVRLMEALHQARPKARFFQASSAEMFGSPAESPQSERTRMNPLSPYGYAKVFAHGMIGYYREVHKLYAVSGILFNHESPRRGPAFVTRKITLGLAGILAGRQDKIVLGSLEAKRDWGYAKDYAEAMWLSLQQDAGDDYVIATGENHTIQEFLEEAFSYAGLDYKKYVEAGGAARVVDIKERVGDSSKARKKLGWRPTVTFRQLVRLMVDADMAAEGLTPPKG